MCVRYSVSDCSVLHTGLGIDRNGPRWAKMQRRLKWLNSLNLTTITTAIKSLSRFYVRILCSLSDSLANLVVSVSCTPPRLFFGLRSYSHRCFLSRALTLDVLLASFSCKCYYSLSHAPVIILPSSYLLSCWPQPNSPSSYFIMFFSLLLVHFGIIFTAEVTFCMILWSFTAAGFICFHIVLYFLNN